MSDEPTPEPRPATPTGITAEQRNESEGPLPATIQKSPGSEPTEPAPEPASEPQ